MFMIYYVVHNNKHQLEHVLLASNIAHDNQPDVVEGSQSHFTNVLECNFHLGYKWILANVSMTRCEAKPTTLKRPSPGDGFENHMYFLELWNKCEVNLMFKRTHMALNHCALLTLASWLVVALAFSRVQPAALATHALEDIPLVLLILTFVVGWWQGSLASSITCEIGLID